MQHFNFFTDNVCDIGRIEEGEKAHGKKYRLTRI